jgi:hypothetical protein
VNERVFGRVLNINAYGAAIRLESGELASAPAADVDTHRAEYERALTAKKELAFLCHATDRRTMVTIAPLIEEPQLDAQITHYFKSTQEWDADEDGRLTHERHFLRKKKRAASFE